MPILRRAALIALAIEVPLIIMVAAWGIPSPVTHDPVGGAIETTHTLGIWLLEALGLCCGYVNSLVIGDGWTGPVQHLSVRGLIILAVANWLVLTGVIYLLVLGKRAFRSAEPAAA